MKMIMGHKFRLRTSNVFALLIYLLIAPCSGWWVQWPLRLTGSASLGHVGRHKILFGYVRHYNIPGKRPIGECSGEIAGEKNVHPWAM